jgi:hypothetical protein
MAALIVSEWRALIGRVHASAAAELAWLRGPDSTRSVIV